MDVAIYVEDPQAARSVSGLLSSVGKLPDGYNFRVVELNNNNNVPIEVLRTLMQRPGTSLPLTVIDGAPTIAGRLPTPYEILSLLPDDGTRPAVITSAKSAVDFAGEKRFHISLNVSNLEASLPFYETFFDTKASKVRPKYAKFELSDPPINFTLNEREFDKAKKEGPVGHFGWQVKSSGRVAQAKARFVAAGFHVEEEMETACCFAVQSKIWVADPDLNKWEVYVVTEAESEAGCGPDCICLICYKDMKASTVKS
jgi:hypothetical protein